MSHSLPAGGSILTSSAYFDMCVCRIAKVLEVEFYILIYFILEISTAVLIRVLQTEMFYGSTLILTLYLGLLVLVPRNN